jgi:hypothetical protein
MYVVLLRTARSMRIDPESWPALSKLLDEWLDLPEESRAGWLESLGPEHAAILPALRQNDGSSVERFRRLPQDAA